MGFKCYASGEYVANQRRVLVPIETRKVRYVGMFKPNPKEEFLQFGASFEGWEIVKEVPVAECNYKAFIATTGTPKIVGEKEVRYMLPRKKKVEETKSQRDDDYDDKPEID